MSEAERLAALRAENIRLVQAVEISLSYRAEAVRLREALEDLLDEIRDLPDPQEGPGHQVVDAAREVLSSTPATQKEVERVRAMERVVEAYGRYIHDSAIEDSREVDAAFADYELVVKEKP
jgi:hypothetical protein